MSLGMSELIDFVGVDILSICWFFADTETVIKGTNKAVVNVAQDTSKMTAFKQDWLNEKPNHLKANVWTVWLGI